MDYTKLIQQQISGGRIDRISEERAYHLEVPAGSAKQYRLAQLDDYAKRARSRFPWRPPVSLTLSARASGESIPGTWGFGFWNYPFGMSLGFSEDGFRLPALPNTVWFFHASEENYLSFGDKKAPHGFLAQSFRAPWFQPLLILAGTVLPFSRKLTRRLLARVIEEDAVDLRKPPAPIPSSAQESASYTGLDVTQWHRYRLDWREEGVSFAVDDVPVFESTVTPKPPLGLVIWIDNQYAAFTPQGKIGFGILENPEPAWLEVKEIDVERGAVPHDRELAG